MPHEVRIVAAPAVITDTEPSVRNVFEQLML